MDLFGVQLLVGIVLTILIVFPGTVIPAYKQFLDTIVGRLVAIAGVIGLTHMGGWPIGALAATAVLILTPNTMREGFWVAERPLVQNSRTGVEGFMLAQQASSPNAASLHEGFNGANKIQAVPKERQQRWFVEQVMHEKPRKIETDTATTEAVQ